VRFQAILNGVFFVQAGVELVFVNIDLANLCLQSLTRRGFYESAFENDGFIATFQMRDSPAIARNVARFDRIAIGGCE